MVTNELLQTESADTCLWLTTYQTAANQLVNDGVSLATIRKRLGHKNLQTTLR